MATAVPGGIFVDSQLAAEYASICSSRSDFLANNPIAQLTSYLAALQAAATNIGNCLTTASEASSLFNSDNPPYYDEVHDYSGDVNDAVSSMESAFNELNSLIENVATLLGELTADQSFCSTRAELWSTIREEKLKEETEIY